MYKQLNKDRSGMICQDSCTGCLKKEFSLFSDLSFEELTILNQNRQKINYKVGEYIFKEGTRPFGLWCLNKGKVKITKQGIDDNTQIVDLKKPVDFLGLTALTSKNNYSNSAIVLEESSICFIDKVDFFNVVKNNPQLSFKIIQWLANASMMANERLINLTQKHLRGRLAEALLLIHDFYGVDSDNILNVKLKRAEVAALANMITSNAIRTLSSFKKEKLIDTSGRKIEILDLSGLRSISDIPW